MGHITIRELENMDFFKEIPKDILQNLLNESKVVSYKKKEVIFHSRSRTKTVDRKSTRLNSSHTRPSRMPSSA